MFSFERSFIPFLRPQILEIDPNVVGLFCVYNEVARSGSRDFVPTYWGYGKVQECLLGLLSNPCVSTNVSQYCGYQSDIRNPEMLLDEVKRDFPPLCSE